MGEEVEDPLQQSVMIWLSRLHGRTSSTRVRVGGYLDGIHVGPALCRLVEKEPGFVIVLLSAKKSVSNWIDLTFSASCRNNARDLLRLAGKLARHLGSAVCCS